MGPQLMLTTKDCMPESRLRENNYLNKGIDRCTFYGGKNANVRRFCDQYQTVYQKTEGELFQSPKRSRVENECSPTKTKQASSKCFQPKNSNKGSLLSILENEDAARTPVVRTERRGQTWKVKTEQWKRNNNAQERCKSLGKLRGSATSSNSSLRQFGRVLPKIYTNARQCLDFGTSREENPPKVNFSSVDFTDDDDKENIDADAVQSGASQLNIEGIIESLSDADFSPIKQASTPGPSRTCELFEDEVAGPSTSLAGTISSAEKCEARQDTCLDKEPHHIGFPNPAGSNKCWMNATLQAVLGLEPLVRDVVCVFQQLDGHMKATGTAKVLSAFLLLVKSRQKRKLPVIRSSLLTLSRTLGSLDKVFLGRCQQDAAEFLVRLLDCFRDEFEKAILTEKQSVMEKISLEDLITDGDNTSQKITNPITDNVGFTLKETSTCTKCKETADKRQDHLVLFVDIPPCNKGSSPSLQDAVDDYMKVDTRELTCGKCGHSERSVSTTVQKLPRCLIIQVKRYTMHNSVAEKLADALAIPLVFSMKKYVDSDTALPSLMKPDTCHGSSANEEDSVIQCDVPVDVESDCDDDDKDLQEAVRQSLLTHDEQEQALDCTDNNLDEQLQAISLPSQQDDVLPPQEIVCSSPSECLDDSPEYSYNLVGAISHYGLSPNSGHYVADVYSHQQHKWYHYDDEVVHETCERNVTGRSLQCNGYIFFYMYRPLLEQLAVEESQIGQNVDS